MNADTEQLPADIALVLPGDWWQIPLQDDEARTRSIDALLKLKFKGVDDQPIVKADLRRDLQRSTGKAAQASGHTMGLWMQEIGGTPVSATLTIYWIPLGPPVQESHLDDMAVSLQEIDEEENDPENEPDLAVTVAATFARSEIGIGRVLRRVRVVEGGDPQLTPDGYETLIVDYWIEMPAKAGLVQVCASTPMLHWKQPMVDLFDAIVDTSTWQYEVKAED